MYFTVTAGALHCPAVCMVAPITGAVHSTRAWALTTPQACGGLRGLGVRPLNDHRRLPQRSLLILVTGVTAGDLRDTSPCYSRYVCSHHFTAFI